MNGNTLKWAFSVIVWTMCGVLVASTAMCLFGKLTFTLWVDVMKELGVPAFFTMVVQSFLHSDKNHDGIPDVKQILQGGEHEKTITASTTVTKSISDKPVVSKPDDEQLASPAN